MRNPLKQAWREGRQTVNGWLSIGNAFSAEIMASAGFDSIAIDMQHGFLDFSDVAPMFQAMTGRGSVAMARVPALEPAILMKVLDAGALGVICPMVSTPEQAATLVRHTRYPPIGERSFGPTRAKFVVGEDYFEHANDEILVLAMIETAEGYANRDAIVATPGIDGIYIGPADLSLALGQGRIMPGFDREEPEMIEAIRNIIACCKTHRKVSMLHCGTPGYARRALSWGLNGVTVSGDTRILAQGSAHIIAEMQT